MAGILLDTRLALRRLRREPAVVVAVILCLALGFAGTLTVVRITDTLWFGAPPGVQGASLVRRLLVSNPEHGSAWFSPYLAYSTISALGVRLPHDVGVAAVKQQDVAVDLHGQPLAAGAGLVTDGFFKVLRMSSYRGRALSVWGGAGDEVALSYRFAVRWFGDADAAVGRTLRIGRRMYVVTSVMPPGFLGTELQPTDIWLHVNSAAGDYLPTNWQTDPGAALLQVLIRLPSSSMQRRVEELASAVYRADQGPSLKHIESPRIAAVPLQLARTPLRSDDAVLSGLLFALSTLLWLAVCANVGGLVLVRAVVRRHEGFLCLAVGASPARVMRVWLIEIAALVLSGVASGGLLAVRVQRLVIAAGLVGTVETYRSSVGRMAVAMAVLTVAAITSGIWSARREVGRRDLAAGLSGASRSMTASRSRVQRGLLAIQVIISSALLYAAGLFVASYRTARVTPVGFKAEGLLVAWANTPAAGYSVQQTDQIFRDLAARARLLPGVTSASVGVSIPFLVNLGERVYLPGQEAVAVSAYVDIVEAGHLGTLGVPLVGGRDFNALLDSPGGQPTVILSAALARHLFDAKTALGRCVVVTQPPCRVVVGVSGDLLQVNLRMPVPHVYLPLEQNVEYLPSRALFVRMQSSNSGMRTSIERELQGRVPGAPLEFREMAELLDAEMRPWQLSATVLSAFSILALCISTIGVFGVASYWISQRTREIGIRLALGASGGRIASEIVRSVMPATAWGAVVGVVLGGAAGRAVSAQLFGVAPLDARLALLAGLSPVVAAVAAALYPTIMALRANPIKALQTL